MKIKIFSTTMLAPVKTSLTVTSWSKLNILETVNLFLKMQNGQESLKRQLTKKTEL